MIIKDIRLKTKQKVIYKDLFYFLQYINGELYIVNENENLFYDCVGLQYSYEVKEIIDDILVCNKTNINKTKESRNEKLKIIKKQTKETRKQYKQSLKENKQKEKQEIKQFIKESKGKFKTILDPQITYEYEKQMRKDEIKQLLERVERLVNLD